MNKNMEKSGMFDESGNMLLDKFSVNLRLIDRFLYENKYKNKIWL